MASINDPMKHLLVLLKGQNIFRKEIAGECLMLFGMNKEKKRTGDMQGIVNALQDERGKLCSPGQETRKELCMLYKMKGQPVVAWYIGKLVCAPLC